MLSPESALVLSSRRVVATWNAEQLRLYAALEEVDPLQLRAERTAGTRIRPAVASGPPAVPKPPNGAPAAPRARSWTP